MRFGLFSSLPSNALGETNMFIAKKGIVFFYKNNFSKKGRWRPCYNWTEKFYNQASKDGRTQRLVGAIEALVRLYWRFV